MKQTIIETTIKDASTDNSASFMICLVINHERYQWRKSMLQQIVESIEKGEP